MVQAQNLLFVRKSILEEKCIWVLNSISPLEVRYPRAYSYLKDELTDLKSSLDLLNDGLTLHNAPLAGAQADLYEIQRRCRSIFNEVLAFLHGRWLYVNDMKISKLVDIAEALNEELSKQLRLSWGRPVVLAEEEFITDCAGIIRLGFPLIEPWSLPVVAHEVAHHLSTGSARADTRGTTLAEFIQKRQVNRNEKDFNHLTELVADLFATLIIGPAYGCSCLLLLFETLDADIDYSSHPSHNRRAAWILEGLDQSSNGLFNNITDTLRHYWEIQGGSTKELSNQDKVDFNNFYQFFQTNDFRHALYSERDALHHCLTLFENGSLSELNNCNLRNILNASWYMWLNKLQQESFSRMDIETKFYDWWNFNRNLS